MALNFPLSAGVPLRTYSLTRAYTISVRWSKNVNQRGNDIRSKSFENAQCAWWAKKPKVHFFRHMITCQDTYLNREIKCDKVVAEAIAAD